MSASDKQITANEGHLFVPFNFNPPMDLRFCDSNQHVIARFYQQDGKLRFEGDADDGAKAFVEHVLSRYDQGLKAAESLYRELKHAQYDIHVGDDTYRCAKCAGSRQTGHAADCARAKALRDWEGVRDAR